MSHIDDAAELRAVALDIGLRVHDLRTNHPSVSRYSIALEPGVESDRIYVHASPTRISISLDRNDAASQTLTSDEALEQMLEAVGA